MMKRKVLFLDESGGSWPWYRQLRHDGDTWGQSSYSFSCDFKFSYDWLVVFSAWPELELTTSIPRSRRIFVAGEPKSFHRYQSRFLEQFGTILTTQSGTNHPGAVYGQPGINWFAGVLFQNGPDKFKSLLKFKDFENGNPPKTKLCSVICSTNAVTKGHRKRIEFVNLLREKFSDQIDFYGRGIRTIQDKDIALANYRYHIALENSVHDDYWTEKLSDSFLRGCFPIYSGCPNLSDYFPRESYLQIDIQNPGIAMETIANILKGHNDKKYASALAEAKRRVLYEYNIFPTLENIFIKIESTGLNYEPNLSNPVRLYSDHETKNFRLGRRLKRWIHNYLI